MFSLWHYYIILYFALQGTKLCKKENVYFSIHINFDIDFSQQGVSGHKKTLRKERKAKGFCFRERSGQN